MKITDIRTRRNFISASAGAIATGAALLPNGKVQAEMSELEQMAQALHDAVGRYSDRNAPFFPRREYPALPRNCFGFAMENMRYCSVDEIQDLLKSLFEGGAK